MCQLRSQQLAEKPPLRRCAHRVRRPQWVMRCTYAGHAVYVWHPPSDPLRHWDTSADVGQSNATTSPDNRAAVVGTA
jgi:hypothetical protein